VLCGYSRLKPEAGNLFFQLVCMRYEQGSMILTNNKGFADINAERGMVKSGWQKQHGIGYSSS
jgi:hypothetical protein